MFKVLKWSSRVLWSDSLSSGGLWGYRIGKGYDGTFWDYKYVLHLVLGGCYRDTLNHQKSSDWTLKFCAFYYV